MLWFFAFLKRRFERREMIAALTLQALRTRYVGTVGGFAWALAQPLAMIATYWFVFSLGFKLRGSGGEPFILFFVVGMAPWLFFSEAVTAAAGSVVGQPHLVKKIVFPTEILPIVQVSASATVHLLVLAITAAIMAWYGRQPGWHAIFLLYYMAAAAVLAVGLGWLTAALQVFFRDVAQIIPVLFGFWFWLTPIVWSAEILPAGLHGWLRLNPVHYLVQGYRDSLIYGLAPTERLADGLVFWLQALFVLALGVYVFRRLKPEFAEVI
jgi:ABC-type polysaccharide/polyol phosphate export permease